MGTTSSRKSLDYPNRPTILVTGGCGYIGTHTVVCLLQQGANVVVVDNLSNSSIQALYRVREICELDKSDPEGRLTFVELDLCDEDALRKEVFEVQKNKRHQSFQGCIHFAGLKAVGESTRYPVKYYQNNLGSTLTLLKLLDEYCCHSIVFSSSATVYGVQDKMPIAETATVGSGITNAYGRSKYMIEEILRDFYNSQKLGEGATDWSIVVLRYFNPIGSHPSGKIGEDPNGIPNNLMPYVAQVAGGRRPHLTVFGNDYQESHDGTGVRDYLHVMDLAEGHICALRYIERHDSCCAFFNLGTGKGYSVLDMVKAMEKASGKEIPYKIGPRRPGDVAVCYADSTAAYEELEWKATRNLDDMCRDLWKWQSLNPNGYGDILDDDLNLVRDFRNPHK